MIKQCILFFFLGTLMVFGQEKQPKVGLVLSGGGAKGFAHIGVLKEIEKAGIQIDYIGGTSMGAIIGGLYAAGYSASQIEKIILETDFYTLLQDKNPRRTKTLFEKQHGEKHAVVLPVVKGKIGLPKGVSKGQNVLNFLTYLLSPVDSITDFSKLPIPFFCIGTDVETGEEIILNSGSLPLALRASGSFPTLLNPVEINGKLLIDGGVSNNFPVDILKRTGVDIIIGVDVQGKLYNKEDIVSVLDVLNQITSYQMYKKSSESAKKVDVYVKPEVTEYTVVSFENSKEILERGHAAALKHSKTFDSIASLQKVKRLAPEINTEIVKFHLDKIEILGNQNYTRAFILGAMKISEGDSITAKEISEKINYLSSTNNFQRIDFALEGNTKGKKLVLQVKESNDKSNIRLGVHYDMLYESGVLLNYTHKNLLIKNDELSLDLIVGDTPRYTLDYFVDNGFYYSYGFNSRYNSFNSEAGSKVLNVEAIDIQYTDFTNRIYMQTTFDRKFAIGAGLEHKIIKYSSKTLAASTNQPLVFDDSQYFNVISYLNLDTYDNKDFPTKGVYFSAKYTWYLWSTDYAQDFVQFSQIKGKVSFAKSFGEKFTFEYISEAGFTLGDVSSESFDFSLGGYNQNFINNFVPLYGYEISSLSDQTFLKSTFNFRYNLVKNHYVSFLANYARVADSVFKNGDLFKDTKSGYAFGYSLKTFIGPIELKYSWSPDTKNHFWYFNLGFWF